jgi:hypothetical protein
VTFFTGSSLAAETVKHLLDFTLADQLSRVSLTNALLDHGNVILLK